MKQRLDRVLKIYSEYGIEDVQTNTKPRIAFLASSGSDEPYQCTQKHEIIEEPVPTDLSLRALKKTMILSGVSSTIAIIILLIEILTRHVGRKLQTRRDKKHNEQKIPPKRALSSQIAEQFSYGKQIRWLPCEVFNFDIKQFKPLIDIHQYSAYYNSSNERIGNTEILKVDSDNWKPALFKTYDLTVKKSLFTRRKIVRIECSRHDTLDRN